MFKNTLILMLAGSILLLGCPADFSKLKLENQSDFKIKTLMNLSYPDSSLSRAAVTRYIDPHETRIVGGEFDLENGPGITLFVFDHSYFKSKWHESVGTPDTFLVVDSILKKFVLSKSQLDSLNWRLVFR